MKKFPMDLSRFKKVSSDQQSSVLKHQDGHEIKIAHSGLTENLRKKLDELPIYAADGMLTPEKSAEDAFLSQYVNAPQSSPMEQAPAVDSAVAEKMAQAKAPTDTLATQPTAASVTPQPETSPLQAAGERSLTALEAQKAGALAGAQALGEQGRQEQVAAKAFQTSLQTAQNQFDEKLNEIRARRTQLQNELNDPKNEVNPDKFIQHMTTGQKIATGISLFFGALGAGMTGRPDTAYEFFQNQINRDIDAQKSNIEKKNSLLRHNLEEEKDLRAATDATRIQMNDIFSAKLKGLAGQAQSQQQAANLLTIAGKFDEQSAMLERNLALSKMLLSAPTAAQAEQGNIDAVQRQQANLAEYLRQTGQPEVAKDLEAKTLPGVPGKATIEIPQEMRKEWGSLKNLDKLYAQSEDYLKRATSGRMRPGEERAVGTSLMNAMELTLGELVGLGRFTTEEAKRYREMFPDLTGSHLTNEDLGKIRNLQNILRNKQSTLLESVGLSVPQQYKPTNLMLEGRTGTLPSGEKVQVINGRLVKIGR